MNRVFLIGNIGQDPETIEFDNGGKICKFSVATTERWKDKTTGEDKTLTVWHNIQISRPKLAEIADRWIKKGMKVMIEGMIMKKNFTPEGKQPRQYVYIACSSFEMLSRVDASESKETEQPGDTPDDDLPF